VRLDELVQCWLDGAGGPRTLAWGPRTEELSGRIANTAAEPTAAAEPGAERGKRLVVARPPLGEAPGALPGLLGELEAGDVLLLLLPKDLDELSPGPLLEALRECAGLIVGLHEVEDRLARTALAVTTDPSVPVLAPVSLAEIAAPEAADVLRNEWLLVGAGQRARLDRLEARVQGHRREITMVRSERNIARKRWEDEKATSRALREQIAALETDLAAERARPETGMEAVSRRIAKVKSDPVKSTRAIARRLRGH
jgi:hypothetical protein